jgi:hypothetical protein
VWIHAIVVVVEVVVADWGLRPVQYYFVVSHHVP